MTSRLTIPQGSSKPSHSTMSAMKRVSAAFSNTLPATVTNGSSLLRNAANHHTSSSSSSASSSSSQSSHSQQYLSRLFDIGQMDIQSALEQMRCLVTHQAPKVYKLAYYRKQTKGHWSRDDPGFLVLQVTLLALSSVAHCIAFRSDSILYNTITFTFHSILVNYLGLGALLATLGRMISNQHLSTVQSTAHVKQSVEWMYALDIHCNAFVPLFALLYGVQFFLLPLVLQNSFLAFLTSNTLYALAFGYYFYVTHLGYRALPFLVNTEVFLFPICGVLFLFLLNLLGYPFGMGFNASRIFAHLYFERLS